MKLKDVVETEAVQDGDDEIDGRFEDLTDCSKNSLWKFEVTCRSGSRSAIAGALLEARSIARRGALLQHPQHSYG